MRRRQFITLVGGAAAWPFAARGQQRPKMPVIAFLLATPQLAGERRMTVFRQSLQETGYVEGQNASIVSVGANGALTRLQELAAELVRRQVSVIVSPVSSFAAIAAREATKVTPIVFSVSTDPVAMGLVETLARPGGNATGVNTLQSDLMTKRLGLLRELLPGIKRVAALYNPTTRANQAAVQELHAVTDDLHLQFHIVNASTSGEISAAFETMAHERPDALLIIPDPLFGSRVTQIALLAARHRLAAIYSQREHPEGGGLMSYGTSLVEVYRQMGEYTGRILKGDKPAELPVVQSSKFELVINLQAANALGLTVPPSLLARADEVIE